MHWHKLDHRLRNCQPVRNVKLRPAAGVQSDVNATYDLFLDLLRRLGCNVLSSAVCSMQLWTSIDLCRGFWLNLAKACWQSFQQASSLGSGSRPASLTDYTNPELPLWGLQGYFLPGHLEQFTFRESTRGELATINKVACGYVVLFETPQEGCQVALHGGISLEL